MNEMKLVVIFKMIHN